MAFWRHLVLVCITFASVQACGPMANRFCTCPGMCCVPGGGGFYPDSPIPTLQSVLGGNIRMDSKIRDGKLRSGVALAPGNATKKLIGSSQDLSCTNWDTTCQWRNPSNGALGWYRGSGTPDIFRLKIATGSATAPRPPFAIVATNQALPSSENAPLISDPIACQTGDGEVRFAYWTSPQVRLTVCWRKVNSETYNFCSQSIANGDPGPAVAKIPGPIKHPFELAIIADNFVYNDGKYVGGFAIIDDLEYNAQICSKLEPEDGHFVGQRKTHFEESSAEPESEITLPPMKTITAPKDDSEACRLVDCNFREGACMNYISSSDFSIYEGPIGNSRSAPAGHRGDEYTSQFNASKAGEFAYAAGPKGVAQFTIPPFTLHEARILRFSYYPAAPDSKFRVVAQREKEREAVVFESPDADENSRHWILEALPLKAGRYEKIIFEAADLRKNTFIGIDEIKLKDFKDQPVCE